MSPQRHAARLAALGLVTVLGLTGPAPAADFGGGRLEERYFAIAVESATRGGRPVVRAHVTSSADFWISRMVVRVEALDAGGQVVATSTPAIVDLIPPFGRLTFEVPAPAAGASYRISVINFDWLPRGGVG
jgi:hypothetical protein